MKPHPRIRKAIKWGGAAVTVFFVLVWIGSGWWYVSWTHRYGTAGVSCGRVMVLRCDFSSHVHLHGWRVQAVAANPVGGRFFSLPYRWSDAAARLTLMPFWCILPFPLLASIIAWRFDVMARSEAMAHRCPRCGYDRKSLPLLAECPECGSGNPQGKLRPLRAAVAVHGFNALLVAAVVAAIVVMLALGRALW